MKHRAKEAQNTERRRENEKAKGIKSSEESCSSTKKEKKNDGIGYTEHNMEEHTLVKKKFFKVHC